MTVEDLLLHYPRGYIDLTAPCEVMSAPLDQVCAVRATVIKKGRETRLRGGLRLYKVIAADDSGVLELTFFNTKFTVDALKIDEPYLFYGRMEGTLLRREMRAPAVYPERADQPFIAVYPLTEGLTQKAFANLVEQALGARSRTGRNGSRDSTRRQRSGRDWTSSARYSSSKRRGSPGESQAAIDF